MSDVAVKPAPMFPIDLENAPKITLAGREWAIPTLAIAQNRIIVPAVMKTLGLMKQIASAVEQKETNANWYQQLEIGTEDFDRLCTITHAALTRGYPSMSRGEFDQMPISFAELVAAAPIIMNQTGSFQAANKDAKPGEAQAAGTESTSTSSSPTTANAPESPGLTS
jgi:hypothetical protein